MNRKFTILYVDDENANLNAFRNTFRREYNILTAETAEQGLLLLQKENVDLILSDQRMPGMSGVEFFKRAIETHPEPNRILITAYTDFDAIESAINEAAIFKYVKKPWDPDTFKEVIDKALELYDLRRRNAELTRSLKAKNKELEIANLELMESDQLKYDFLKIISHEIRTPLNGLKGATQLFKASIEKSPPPESAGLFKLLDASAQRLEQFLLLAERITNLKARRYPLDKKPARLAKLAKDAAGELRDAFAQNRQTVLFDTDDSHLVEADAPIFSICIREILHNATRHSPIGSAVTIRSIQEGDQIVLEIKDQGKGFPERVLKNIFKVFVREDDDTDRRLGLNLALTKLVMDLHGGKAEAYNHSDGGALVRLSLPKVRAAESAEAIA
ncbi:hybrid sensor histidine kinase/response regulator [Pelagicoccus sp. SDUM812003]|uniref:hybrid sensor histidine kinase/response regulator n=1 Tax=Pelagicoccus sp. SDUM812003 TaxID=3041267 RepID=UPI00280F408A|nr:hybrid sensor histidine kinase/response regulator [Pelagicoccus sp. SDUM812003]MDQ8205298.1 hybrid sensor histidine kinase/response regulator [Pelagicoccus sp. SDUM812003]